MSNQNNNLDIAFNNNNNNNNINLISMDKSPNQIINNLTNQENNNPNKENFPSNNLINLNEDEESNFSNIKIDKLNKKVDLLFMESEAGIETSNLNDKQNIYPNYNKNNNNIESNRFFETSMENMSINEEKRIEAANNLFDKSLTMSINSYNNTNNNNMNNISESEYTINYDKRKEAADKLFQSQTDILSRNDSLDINLNNTIKSNKTNMSNVINNLSGSNIGLNINALANKFAEKDNMIYESLRSNENKEKNNICNISNISNNNINNVINEYNDENDEIKFNHNLIDFSKKQGKVNFNDLNNLNTNSRNKKPSKSLKSDLITSSKKNNLKKGKNILINTEKKNPNLNLDINSNDEIINNQNNKNNKKIIIIDENSIRNSTENNIKEKEILKNNNKKGGINLKELFTKSKKNGSKLHIEDKKSEEERSKDILMKKNKEKDKNKIKINDSFSNNLSLSLKEKEKDKNSLNIISKEIKETNNDSNHLISDKTNFLKGRGSLLKEDSPNITTKSIQIHIKKKENKNILDENDNININNIDSISFEEDKDKNLVVFNSKKFLKEKKFKDFLKDKKLYYNDKLYNKKENEKQMKYIKENKYFSGYIFNENEKTFFDEIIKGLKEKDKNKKTEILFYYKIMKSTYEKNKANFNLIFQSVTNEDKEKIYKMYKNKEKYNIENNYISPYLNDAKIFLNDFNIKLKKNSMKNIDYLRYTLDENNGDTFYRCFLFNLFEKKIMKKDKEYIYMIIFDIFKIYDLDPDIYNNENNDINFNINNILIFFDILRDYIELNQWDRVYDFFFVFFSQISTILIIYIKYNLFLLMTKLYSLNEENKSYNNDTYLSQYQKILIPFNEPNKLIFQLLAIIFGFNLNIIFIKNKEDDILIEDLFTYEYSKYSDDDNNDIDAINILFYNDCYHIGYQKKDFMNNNDILNSIKENLNNISLIQYTKKGKIKCPKCKKKCDFIEINNESNNKGLCYDCLYEEIDEYLMKRIEYIKEDTKKNYINYSYYLRPIELFLQEPLSVKNGIENNSILIKNIDYFLIYESTFSQRIKELIQKNDNKEESNENGINDIKINNLNKKKIINRINDLNINNISNEDSQDNSPCLKCGKTESIFTSSCGCKFCDDCIYDIIDDITSGQIILNGYEKKDLNNKNKIVCPICDQKLDLNFLIMLLQSQGRNFENEYNEAILRMESYCQNICFNCLKKFSNENSIEVEHNKNKERLIINVVINKYCLKEAKKNNNNENEIEKGIDYNDIQHVLCYGCYKKIKIKRNKEISDIMYNVIGCNICGINHYISEKDWNKYNKHDVCCKCNIF